MNPLKLVLENSLEGIITRGKELVQQFQCSDVQKAHFEAQMKIAAIKAKDHIELFVAENYTPRKDLTPEKKKKADEKQS